MPKFKLNSKILGFKSLTGMIAQVFNEDGDLLDSINLNESKSKLKFRFDKDDALQGEKNADLTIKLIDTNGDDINLNAADGSGLDLDSDEQNFTASIKGKRRKDGLLCPTAAATKSSTPTHLCLPSGQHRQRKYRRGTVIYDAEASDASDPFPSGMLAASASTVPQARCSSMPPLMPVPKLLTTLMWSPLMPPATAAPRPSLSR